MESSTAPFQLIDDPKQLLLEMARQRSVDDVLRLVVHRLTDSPRVALARVWLMQPGEGCDTCPMRGECPDRTTCLHLVASAGTSVTDPDNRLDRLDGHFRRFPLGVRKVGRIAATGQPIEVPDLNEAPDWIARPEWVRSEGIQGFGGQPLIAGGQVLGVLGVFTRVRIDGACLDWLRMIADHAATALANARAWEEVGSLRRRLELENAYLQEEVRVGDSAGDMVGTSPALETVRRQIALVAPTDSNVLILGESGTGKELVAREIHQRSGRAERALIKVNCAAIPRDLFDSEFFGHARGSFTGALRDRMGRFELADGGTLFLDEIGEIPLDLQGKLLRVLQEGELQRVGEERTRRVDVRIIAATNRDLKAESARGVFRDDLYYRLSVFPIELPPLRVRRDDIPALAGHFISLLARRLGRPTPRLTLAQLQQLQRHDWPGNIRELQHVLERALITAPRGRLTLEPGEPPTGRAVDPAPRVESAPADVMTAADLRTLEAENIRRALRAANGRIYGADGAAARIGLKPTTLASRMKSLGITTSVVVQ